MHCPFYNTFASHQHEKQEEQMKQHLEPLFVRFEVNIVVAGHTHAYR
jgi:predicted phosphodiesterase